MKLKWKSEKAAHEDRPFAEKIDFWSDLFPDDMQTNMGDLFPGETFEKTFDAGVLTPGYSESNIKKFPLGDFETERTNTIINPKNGRFYPQEFAWKSLHCFPGNICAFRIIDIDDETITADTNHPLSKYKLAPSEQSGCNSIGEMATSYGPGMQTPTRKLKQISTLTTRSKERTAMMTLFSTKCQDL